MQKSGHVERAVVKNLRTTSKRFRYAVCGESGSEGGTPLEPWMNALVVRVWGPLGGYYDTPPKGAPEPRTIFRKLLCVIFGENVDVSRAYG